MQTGLDATDSADLGVLLKSLEQHHATNIGFPIATDIDYAPVLPVFGQFVNNIGDPFVDPAYPAHAKSHERDVISFFADLFKASAEDRWGYVTSGGSEGNLYALYLARSLYPGAMVYFSDATHYSVEKALHLLGMPSITVRTASTGEIDYGDLRWVLDRNRDRPAVVVANIGTTMTEAIDDVRMVKQVLDDLAFRDYFLHSDAALAGIPLALQEEPRPGFDFADGADSICLSGHKFLGTPIPCGVVLTRRSLQQRVGRPVAYTGSPDTTITGCRSGHAGVLMSYAIERYGVAGLRERAALARDLAAYTVEELTAIGWPAWRAQQHAFTVVLDTPPPAVTSRWTLASNGRYSHVICMPGVTRDHIDRFVSDVQASMSGQNSSDNGHNGTRKSYSGHGAVDNGTADKRVRKQRAVAAA